MISPQVYAMASRYGISLTTPELECDIDAQIRCLLDPEHLKTCVFLARGNELKGRELPSWVFVERRSEGTLITVDAAMAAVFRMIECLTDGIIAQMLGYPECKADVLAMGFGMVVQTRDKDDCVIFETAASPLGMNKAMAAASLQMPVGGRVIVVSPDEALARRFKGKMN